MRRIARIVVILCIALFLGGAILSEMASQQLAASNCAFGQQAGTFSSLTPHKVTVNAQGLTVQGSPMTQEQARNAGIILGTVAAHDLGESAARVALITAIVESWIRNLEWGHASSLGLFQQINAWGTAEERRNPVIATEMFLLGGRKGQAGLTDIVGWETMEPGRAAQAVQRSAHPDRYARWIHEADAIIRNASSTDTTAPNPLVTDLSCIEVGADGFVFPLVASQEVIRQGVAYGGGRWTWRFNAPTNYHHDYMAADIHAPVGTPVVAAKTGRVIHAVDTNVGCVNPTDPVLKYRVPRITILGEDGLEYYYTHLQPGSLKVVTGDTVAAGQPLGAVGSGECAQNTGPHLHIHASRGHVDNTEDPVDRAKMIDIQPLLVRAFNAIGRPATVLTTSNGWQAPLRGNVRLTSHYGMRVNPVTGVYQLHDGADLTTFNGDKIYAPLGGTVVFSGTDPEAPWRGEYVRIYHGVIDGEPTYTRYHHMSRTAVPVNRTVTAGQVIGYIGESGTATGPHVHFVIERGGTTVDPVKFYLSIGRSVLG